MYKFSFSHLAGSSREPSKGNVLPGPRPTQGSG